MWWNLFSTSRVTHPFNQYALPLKKTELVIAMNTEIRSHSIIPMATLVDLIIIALSASSTESIKLRTMIIKRIGSVEMMVVTFIETTIIATAILRVDRIGLE